MPVQLPGCPRVTPKPSPLSAAVALAIAGGHDRRWLSAPVATRLPPGISQERLSRIKATVLPEFESLVVNATRRGRPSATRDDREVKLRAAESLLEVAATLIAGSGIHDRKKQEIVVEAALRLKREEGIALESFCEKLGISPRTLRYWMARRKPGPPPEPATKQTENPSEPSSSAPQGKRKPAADAPADAKKPKQQNLNRFGLHIIPPGIQAMADTTDITAFGQKLKLLGAQDTGNRHRKLLESFRVSEAECSQTVIDVVARTFPNVAGTQLLVDQGTPYISEATRTALENKEVDHCPQKEGTPTDKAPLERAWRTIKDGLSPLLDLTNRMAELIPAFKTGAFARAASELLVGTYLRVYAGARAPLSHPLETRDPVELVEIIESARERARAENRSKKLLLQSIHERYAMDGSAAAFVRAHRNAALEDIEDAERRLRDRACRCMTRACDRYFAGILSRVSEEGRARRGAERRRRKEARQRAKEAARGRAEKQARETRPEACLEFGLSLLGIQWRDGRFLFNGKGPGRPAIERALDRMKQEIPLLWADEARAVWRRWSTSLEAPRAALPILQEYLEIEIEKRLNPRPTILSHKAASTILDLKARNRNRRRPWPPHLRI